MSDTPRTDIRAENHPSWPATACDFARNLERELNAWKAVAEQREKEIHATIAERDEWKQCAEELADRLGLHYRHMPNHDTGLVLEKFNALKSKP